MPVLMGLLAIGSLITAVLRLRAAHREMTVQRNGRTDTPTWWTKFERVLRAEAA